MEKRKLTKADLTRNGLRRIINRTIDELNNLSESDLISVWDFFKCLCSGVEDDIVFVTHRDSIIYEHRKELQKNTNIKIQLADQLVAG